VPGNLPFFAYANDDIFFLEACLFSQVCTNGDELFALNVGERWTCEFSELAFRELQQVLLAPPIESADTTVCMPSGRVGHPPCEQWCNSYTCDQLSCVSCGTEKGCASE